VTELDPISLQVVVGALRAACDEMGVVLVRSAHSANIKERRDASTALFDERGLMVMQAEHIPVHLGAMPSAVAAVLDADHAPGDAWILNDPYAGGTHLPDITVVSPVFADGDHVGFAASRAHHADVGAPEPGSMPADSRTLADEGVVIAPTRLARSGELDRELLADLTGRMRNPRASARPTCAPSSPPTAPGRSGSRSWRCARAPTACAPRWRRPRTTPSAARGRGSPRWRTASGRPSTCSRRPGATSSCACARPSAATSWSSTSPAAPRSTRATSTARWR